MAIRRRRWSRRCRRLDLTGLTRRSEADARLAQDVADPALRAFLLQSLSIRDGAAEWKLNLPVLGAEMAEIIGFPRGCRAVRRPGFVRDRGGVGLCPARALAADPGAVPALAAEVIDGAGHWVHAEQPAAFAAAVDAFLRDPSLSD